MLGRLDIDLAIMSNDWEGALPEVASLAQRAARTAWAATGKGYAVEVSVVLSDDANVKRLNSDYRGYDQATNILSFPMQERMEPDGPLHLGDIILSYEMVSREAARDRKSMGSHLSHLVVHGLLHLLGHSHSDEAEALKMEGIELDVMLALGYPNPYKLAPNTAE